MSWRDFFQLNKDTANENNYKLQLFNQVSNRTEIANMSVIKRYFNQLYDSGEGISLFSVNQSIGDNFYVSEEQNKIARLQEYRNMSVDNSIAPNLDMICYSANIPDENDQLIDVRVVNPSLETKDIKRIKDAIQEYLDLFDFENNFEEYFRILITEGQICWENIIAKDEPEAGIIRNKSDSK